MREREEDKGIGNFLLPTPSSPPTLPLNFLYPLSEGRRGGFPSARIERERFNREGRQLCITACDGEVDFILIYININ